MDIKCVTHFVLKRKETLCTKNVFRFNILYLPRIRGGFDLSKAKRIYIQHFS